MDAIESLCMERALETYALDPLEWGVNVQPYSGSPANFATYTALLSPHDRIMGLDLPCGGHLTHGYQTPGGKKVSATSVYFESLPYGLDEEGYVDYADLEYRAGLFRPKILVAGGSAYPREWDYARLREIADGIGAYLMVDMAHVSGLVAAKVADSPFPHAHVVTTTTHKTLRGPRSGMIFARSDLMPKIDNAVFPMLQGGPHNNNIAALCVALKEAQQPQFRSYAQMVLDNARVLGEALKEEGHRLATGGTDNHLLLWDLRPLGLTGSKLEKLLEECSITTNKNSVQGDTSAINPGGLRLGTPALTSRGFVQADFQIVAAFLCRGAKLAQVVQQLALERNGGGKVTYKEFLACFGEVQQDIDRLRAEVEEFSSDFAMPGEQ